MFFLSAAAKLGATVVTYPLLLVKARLQSAGKHTSSDRKYSGTVDAIERIYRTEGGAAPTPPAWLQSHAGRLSPLACWPACHRQHRLCSIPDTACPPITPPSHKDVLHVGAAVKVCRCSNGEHF